MKQFFKFMFASMLGYLLVSIIMFIVFIAMVASIAAFTKTKPVLIKENSVITLKLDEPIPDRTPEDPFSNMDFFSMKSTKVMGLDNMKKMLEKAAQDKNIKGILLDLSDIPASMATIEELRNLLLEFKKSGKFIVTYASEISQRAYYLATVSDKIYLNPEGSLMFKGLSAELMFFKGTLDKLEVQAQIIRHGKFKSAVEPFMLDKMSQANREQYQKLLDGVWKHMLENIAAQRNIIADELNNIADSLKIQTAADALKYKLVDSLLYRDQLLDYLRLKLGLKEKEEISFITGKKYLKSPSAKENFAFGKKKIAVIYAVGEINMGEGDEESIGSETLSEAIRQARNDSAIQAIVLRINSPGGNALASEIIWREVALAKAAKPIVVSMGNLAASGGYYIACSATKIYAQPNTITGSIGVFGVIPNMEKFFKNKLGITFDVVNTNKFSDYITTTRALQPYENTVITNQIENVYKVFLSRVAEGRGMNVADVDTIGQGRIWSGIDAKRIGLVDDLGGLDAAIKEAAKLAKIEDYKIVTYPKYKKPLEKFVEELFDETSETKVKEALGENYVYYKYMKNLQKQKGIQARLPFDMIIY